MHKEFDVKCHYDTSHKSFNKLMEDSKVVQFQQDLSAKQLVFTNFVTDSEGVSCVEAHEISKRGNLSSDGELVRDCLVKVADIPCPELARPSLIEWLFKLVLSHQHFAHPWFE